jgi:hypothetical protein
MHRRRFLKYSGAAAVTVGALAAAYYLCNTALRRNVEVTIPSATKTESTASTRVNHSPVANFKYKPYYLDPTDQQTIQFTNLSTDEDGDPLTYEWLVDNEPVSTEEDYSTKLPVGQHDVRLEVSDPLTKNTTTQTVTVEPDQIYQTKPLKIKHKGIRMTVGWKGMGHTPIDVTEEKLDAIHNELGCNAVIIFGNTEFENDLIEAGKLAIEKGFDRIYIAPMYLDLPLDETVENIGEFARRIKTLRQLSDSIVFMVGHEFTFDSYGLVPGETYPERLAYPIDHPNWDLEVKRVLPNAFRRIIALCKENYGYPITYAATIMECESNLVPWSDPIFESVGTDAYVWDKVGWTQDWIIHHLDRLTRYGKPVNSTEWGCLTYKRASQEWAFTDADLAEYPYDEDEQANYIQQYCEMLNRAKIDGAFYTQIDDERPKGYGLYLATTHPFGPGSSRKKGFYMYKSYQRAS